MEKMKIALSGLLAVITAKLGTLALPVYILVFLNIADYFTGIAAAYYKGEKVCSKKGFRGIAKKVCMWLLIAVGVVIDKIVVYAASVAGIKIYLSFAVGCFVAIWLVCNEIISILENVTDIGVCVPEFLQNCVKKVKEKMKTK